MIFGFAFIHPSSAQLTGIKYFKIEDGSRQIKIFLLFKNFQGYIYAGTSNGLYKFDGLKFTVVPFENEVSDPAISSIFQDTQNQLWVGMQNGNIAKLNNGYLKLFNPEEGTPKKPVTAFLQDRHNNIWFATDGEGMYYTANDHIYNIDVADGLAENNIYTMVLADNGEVLAGSDQGINICKPNGSKKLISTINSKNGLPDNFIKTIVPAGNNKYWIGMQDKGVCLFDNTTKKFITDTIPWKFGQVNKILTIQNNMWIATETNGLLKTSSAVNKALPVRFNGDKSMNINDLLQDNEGNIWLLRNNNELIKTAGEQLTIAVNYAPGEYEKVHAILCDDKNNIWKGTNRGIIKYSSGENETREKKYIINELDSKTDVTALYHDSQDRTWIGTRGKGIFVLDEFTGNYRNVRENELLKNSSVLSITGKDNVVFVTSLEGAASFNLNNDKSNSNYRYINYLNISGIGSNYIYDIFRDSKNRTWFATFGKGITMMQNETITNYNESSGLKDKVVYSVTEDDRGNIWFSTHTAGIYKFDGKKFTNYTTANGLSDLDITAVKASSTGNILIVHKKGIDILDPETGQVSYINGNTGIKEINVQDLGTVSSDTAGGIMVSTPDGIVWYRPQAKAFLHPQTILESVQLFLNAIDINERHTFSYNDNGLSFFFTGLYYTDPDAVQYKYNLDGYSPAWLITKDRTITFPNLLPGDYTFRVRSSVNQLFPESTEASYHFVIKKAFWATWWFIISCVTIAGGLLYWYIKSREKNLKKVERLQQEKIQFQFETLRNQVNPHFLFNSFNTLIAIIEENPKMAVTYVEQLSDFFRNIVTYRDKDVIALSEEIKLLQTYLFIQQQRFGDNLQLKINLKEEEKKQIFIPPLTLQLLAENAIKHNAVSKETLLYIDVYTDKDFLVVRNNINTKMKDASGAGMGLQNITNRYRLLSKKEINIQNAQGYFTVYLPILKQPS